MKTANRTIEDTTRLFAALGDVTRLEILNVLISNPDICVSELANRLNLSVSAVSQQCKQLQLSGLLRRVRHGQRICYQIKKEDPSIEKVLTIIQGVEK